MKAEAYSLQQAARILNISLATLHRHVKAGKIPAIKIERRLVIPRAYIDKLFADAGFPRDSKHEGPAQ